MGAAEPTDQLRPILMFYLLGLGDSVGTTTDVDRVDGAGNINSVASCQVARQVARPVPLQLGGWVREAVGITKGIKPE